MASGDQVLTIHGLFDVSGAALKTKVDSIKTPNYPSGARMFFVPVSNGQKVALYELDITA